MVRRMLGVRPLGPGELQGSRAAQYSRGKPDHCPNQLQHSIHGNPDQSEGQQQEPDEWVQQQCKQRQRPAQHQENAPEQEFDHPGGKSIKNGAASVMRVRSCGSGLTLQHRNLDVTPLQEGQRFLTPLPLVNSSEAPAVTSLWIKNNMLSESPNKSSIDRMLTHTRPTPTYKPRIHRR